MRQCKILGHTEFLQLKLLFPHKKLLKKYMENTILSQLYTVLTTVVNYGCCLNICEQNLTRGWTRT